MGWFQGIVSLDATISLATEGPLHGQAHSSGRTEGPLHGQAHSPALTQGPLLGQAHTPYTLHGRHTQEAKL